MSVNKRTLYKSSMIAAVLALGACNTPSATSSQASTTMPDNTLSAAEQDQGWRLLFDGQNISQWRNFKAEDLSDKWQIQEGALTLTGKEGGDILTKASYQNFDLMLDWKISIAGNSGVFIMADELGNQVYSHAVEIQILDNERHSDNKLDTHLSGSVYDMIASPVSSHKPAGEWNHMRIRVHNSTLKVWQNDDLVADIVMNSPEWNELLSASKFKNWPGFGLLEKGHIGLQDHGDQVAFKNIKILELN